MKSIFIVMTIVWSLGSFAQEDAESRVERIASLRMNVESVLNIEHYKADEHATIKAYFSELSALTEDLGLYSKYRRRFNRFLRNDGVESFCKSAYLDKGRWNTLVQNCTKNNFFLCSEEVRIYPEHKAALKAQLDEDNKTQLERLAICQ